MHGNGVEMSLIFHHILGPLNFHWALNHLALGAQLAPDEIKLVCIPAVSKICVTCANHNPREGGGGGGL